MPSRVVQKRSSVSSAAMGRNSEIERRPAALVGGRFEDADDPDASLVFSSQPEGLGQALIADVEAEVLGLPALDHHFQHAARRFGRSACDDVGEIRDVALRDKGDVVGVRRIERLVVGSEDVSAGAQRGHPADGERRGSGAHFVVDQRLHIAHGF